MNVETGEIKPWDDLTELERKSGKWVPIEGVNRKERRKEAARMRKDARRAARERAMRIAREDARRSVGLVRP